MEPNQLTSETIKEPVSILSGIRSGKPLYEIAADEKISMGEATIMLNAELMLEKRDKDEELKNKIISQFEKGVPVAEILRELPVSYKRFREVITNWSGYQDAVRRYKDENPDRRIFFSTQKKEERNNAAAAAFAEGKSIDEIAGQFSLKRGTVYAILRKKGVTVRKPRLIKNSGSKTPRSGSQNELEQRIIEAYKELRNIPETAVRVNAEYDLVYRILKRSKTIRPKKQRKVAQLIKRPEFIHEIVLAHQEKLTVSEMSARMGISRSRIKKVLIENNLVMYTTSATKADNKKKILIAYLHAKAKLLGRTPTKGEILKDTTHNYMQYYRAFGSYKKAVEASGLKNAAQCRREKTETHKMKLLDELLRIAGELKKTPDEEDIRRHSKYPVREFNRNFGSLRVACRKAGLEVKNVPVNKATNEELIQYLKDLGERYGCTPTIGILKKEKRFNTILFIRRFGNWNIALLSAGFTPNYITEVKPVNMEEALMRVKEYVQQHGVPTVRVLRKECKITELTLYRFFGSYKKLIAEATALETKV